MCGRYRLTAKERYLREHFGLEEDPDWRWGLIPYWAKDQSFGMKTINAMSETAAEKPAFRDALRRRRCLILADAFYEWKKTGPKAKQPYNIGLATGSAFAFAGLWDRWRDPKNNILETCTILTTRPNSLVADVLNRAGISLPRSKWQPYVSTPRNRYASLA